MHFSLLRTWGALQLASDLGTRVEDAMGAVFHKPGGSIRLAWAEELARVVIGEEGDSEQLGHLGIDLSLV